MDRMAGGTGKPQAEPPGRVIEAALVQWADCTEETLARWGTAGNFVHHKLHEAGYVVMRRDAVRDAWRSARGVAS